MAAAVSFVARVRAQASNPIQLRLRLDDEAVVRFIFTEWERVAGIKSNHEAQVAALLDTPRREVRGKAALEVVDAFDAALEVACLGRRAPRPKVPLADRGRSTTTARPNKASGGGFRVQTMEIDGVRCPTGPQERWALAERFRSPAGPMVQKARVKRFYRALLALDAKRPRLVAALYVMYGPRDPSADYVRFGELAPLTHMSAPARELADRATKQLRREIAEREAQRLLERAVRATGERLAVLETASDRRFQGLETVARGLERLEGIDRAERLASGDLAAWTAHRAEVERQEVDPRQALRDAIRERKGAELTALVLEVRRGADQLLVRATNALLAELRAGES